MRQIDGQGGFRESVKLVGIGVGRVFVYPQCQGGHYPVAPVHFVLGKCPDVDNGLDKVVGGAQRSVIGVLLSAHQAFALGSRHEQVLPVAHQARRARVRQGRAREGVHGRQLPVGTEVAVGLVARGTRIAAHRALLRLRLVGSVQVRLGREQVRAELQAQAQLLVLAVENVVVGGHALDEAVRNFSIDELVDYPKRVLVVVRVVGIAAIRAPVQVGVIGQRRQVGANGHAVVVVIFPPPPRVVVHEVGVELHVPVVAEVMRQVRAQRAAREARVAYQPLLVGVAARGVEAGFVVAAAQAQLRVRAEGRASVNFTGVVEHLAGLLGRLPGVHLVLGLRRIGKIIPDFGRVPSSIG